MIVLLFVVFESAGGIKRTYKVSKQRFWFGFYFKRFEEFVYIFLLYCQCMITVTVIRWIKSCKTEGMCHRSAQDDLCVKVENAEQ